MGLKKKMDSLKNLNLRCSMITWCERVKAEGNELYGVNGGTTHSDLNFILHKVRTTKRVKHLRKITIFLFKNGCSSSSEKI